MPAPKSARPSRVKPSDYEFNEVVLADAFAEKDMDNETHWFLLYIDDAYSHCTIQYLASHDTEYYWRCYEDSWLAWAVPADFSYDDNERGQVYIHGYSNTTRQKLATS